jgi:molybdopterin-guanine dinucleotide biosynthesis protein A
MRRPGGRAAPGAGGVAPGRGDSAPRADAIVLAGGRAARLGGADKPALVVGGRSLVGSVVAAAAEAGAGLVVVVGPERLELGLRVVGRPGGAPEDPPGPGPGPEPRLRTVREDPPRAGPVPALRRGLAEVTAPWVFVLAADLPFVHAGHLGSLLAAASGRGRTAAPGGGQAAAPGGGQAAPAVGAVLADDTGRPQWLAGCWQTGALRAAAGRYRGGSLHGLLGPLAPALLWPAQDRAGPPPWLDCDTEDDVRLARAWSGAPARGGPGAPR